MVRRSGIAFDIVWLIALGLYALAGYRDVPFHGDESTHVFMSRDYALLLQQGDLDAVLYRDDPADPAEQELRILNGTVHKYLFGLAWDLAGFSADDLNRPWLWGAPWDWNLTDGHIPSDRLLWAARLASALLTALSAWGVWAIARIAGPGRVAAASASAIYITTPAVLINGRRAMMEGTLLAATVLLLLIALILVRAIGAGRARTWHYAALGVAAGLTLASKHTGAIAIVLAFTGVALSAWGWRPWGRVVAAGILALGVFLLLNPAWWSDPLGMPGRVLELRGQLVEGQAEAYGGFERFDQRADALLRRALDDGNRQYYEAPGWCDWVAASLCHYEATVWDGRHFGTLGAIGLALALMLGSGALLARGEAGGRLVLVWFWGTALALLILTPFDWQRYYLPLQPALAVLAGCGIAATGPVWIALRGGGGA